MTEIVIGEGGRSGLAAKTPSMDDKDTPSPPIRTTEQYLADCELGVQRIGYPTYAMGKR